MHFKDEHKGIEAILLSLSNPKKELNKYRVNGNIKKLQKIYSSNFRHQYSKLFQIITNIDRNEDLDLELLASNISYILEYASSWTWGTNKIPLIACKNKYIIDYRKNFLPNLIKLYDHVNLDVARITYMKTIDQKTDNTRKDLEAAIKQANDYIEISIKKSDDAVNNAILAYKKTKNLQKDYITILGIFAAIILAFVSGLVFSSSVLQNIDKPNTFKLVSIICFLGVFIINILNLLFNLIREIHSGQKPQNGCCSKIWLFNIIMVLIATICLIKSFNYDERVRVASESNSTINVNTANISFSSNR